MVSTLFVTAALDAAAEQGLRGLGRTLGLAVTRGDCSKLVQEVQASAPAQVVAFMEAESLAIQMKHWDGAPPCPISLVSAEPGPGVLERLYGLGLAGWWPETGLATQTLAVGIAQDRSRWDRESALRDELRQARERLEERKRLDRAKGILARAGGLDEDAAYTLLRTIAMQSHQTVGQVSHSVIEAAVWAEALNRAGMLRMLSQRIVKLAVQRIAGVDAHRAGKLQQESERQVQSVFDYLSRLPQLQDESLAPSLKRAESAWFSLKASLAQRGSEAFLKQTDLCADRLLQCSETLVDELEAASHRRALRIINLCGRQRMLVQRMTKEAWIKALTGEKVAQDTAPAKADFEAALIELDHAELTSSDIRDALKATRVEWSRLLQGLRSLKTPEGRIAASRASETLLEAFDNLTASYGRSMQVIMS